jgi:hypothetical protein
MKNLHLQCQEVLEASELGIHEAIPTTDEEKEIEKAEEKVMGEEEEFTDEDITGKCVLKFEHNEMDFDSVDPVLVYVEINKSYRKRLCKESARARSTNDYWHVSERNLWNIFAALFINVLQLLAFVFYCVSHYKDRFFNFDLINIVQKHPFGMRYFLIYLLISIAISRIFLADLSNAAKVAFYIVKDPLNKQQESLDLIDYFAVLFEITIFIFAVWATIITVKEQHLQAEMLFNFAGFLAILSLDNVIIAGEYQRFHKYNFPEKLRIDYRKINSRRVLMCSCILSLTIFMILCFIRKGFKF